MSKAAGKGGKRINFASSSFELATNASQSVRLIENMKIRHAVLTQEINADSQGLEAYDGSILRLKQRKAFLERRIKENEDWAANYDKEFGPFVAKYDEFLARMGTLYQSAKEKHRGGLNLLMEHFGYHPSFKRWYDSFSAVPFKPM